MMVNFPGMAFEDACRQVARLGGAGFDLIQPEDWPTLKKYGLIPVLHHDFGNTFEDGIIHPEVHENLEKIEHAAIDRAAAAGCPNVIVVGGQKRGLAVEQGMDNAVKFLNRLKAHAEDKGVNVVLEPVNPVDRPDQILNRLGLTAEICKRVNSPRVKILFDIYHAAKIDGDVAQHLRDLSPYIGHIHTAGVPERREIDETQELNYHYLAQVLADLDYTGYVAHEFRPTQGRDPVKSFEQAMQIMSV